MTRERDNFPRSIGSPPRSRNRTGYLSLDTVNLRTMSTPEFEFELPNVADGPDPFVLSAVAEQPDVNGIVLLFQRDYHCGNCRRQVQAIAERYDEFTALGGMVVSVLPEPVEDASEWQESYNLPFPLLADPSTAVSDQYDQPVRFGALGSLHDLIGRMPLAIVLDTRSGEPTVAYSYEGKRPADRPQIEELLAQLRRLDET